MFNTARRINTGHLVALIANVNDKRGQDGRVAFIAGKKLGSAPKRNRAKRIMREAAKEAGAPWSGKNVVLIAKTQILDTCYDSVIKDMVKVKSETIKEALIKSK